MKTNLISVLCLLAIAACNGHKSGPDTKLNWLSDLNEAASISKKDGKKMILEVATVWCPGCQFMEEKVFTDGNIAKKLKDFILVRLDGDRPATQTLMDRYDIRGYPTFVIFSPTGAELARFNSLNSADELTKILDDLDSNLPGHKELIAAQRYLTVDDTKKALPLLKAAREKMAPLDPKLSSVLEYLMDCLKDDPKEVAALARELIDKFPTSPGLPVYYEKLAKTFDSSNALKGHYLELAAKTIESRIDNWPDLDMLTRRATAEDHPDLLAEIYKDLRQFSKVESAYKKGASLCEKMIDEGGGLAKNRYLITTVAYYYMSAGDPGHTLKFLKNAQAQVTDYWPIYSNMARAESMNGNFEGALTNAKKAYDLAEDIAKPRVALVWADIYAGKGYFDGAISVITQAEADIKKTGSTESGRSKKILKQLQERREEYERATN